MSNEPFFDSEQLVYTLTQQVLKEISNELIQSADLEQTLLNLGFDLAEGENDPY